MAAPSAPSLPSSSNPNSYVVRVEATAADDRAASPTTDATAAFYGSRSNSPFRRARSMSNASRGTVQSGGEVTERAASIRSATRPTFTSASTDKLLNRQPTQPYTHPRAANSGTSFGPMAQTSLHSPHGTAQNIQSQSHTSHIHPHPSFLRTNQRTTNMSSSTGRKVVDPSFLARPPSIQVSHSDRPIPMSSLAHRPSGRSAISSKSGASGLHVSKKRDRVFDGSLQGYQSDGYISDGPRSGYGSDGPRSGYGSDGPRSGYGSDGPRGYQSDTGRIKRMLPIGPDRPMVVISSNRRWEPELPAAGDRRSWDNRWMEGVEALGIGRGADEKRNERVTAAEEERNIGFGMIVPEDSTRPGEPLSPQEPARSQFRAEGRYGSTQGSPNVRAESLNEEEMGGHQAGRSSKHPRFAPLPTPAPPSHGKTAFGYGSSSEKAHIPLSRQKASGPRNHEGYPSRNSFFCGGQIITGGDAPWPFVGSIVLVLAIAGIWLAGVGRNCGSTWGNRGWAILAVGCYGIALVITSMLITAFRDPGIVPRDLDPDPPYSTTSALDDEDPVPLPRDLRARSGVVRVKFCSTCRTYRPPRSSHCKVCDNCVDGIDHHCTYLHNCVGRRNYTTFMTFLISAVLTVCLVIVTSALELYSLSLAHGSFVSALRTEPLAAVSFAMGIIVIWPVSALLAYHLRLQVLNITTVEQVRAQAHRSVIPGPVPPNAFNLGRWYANMAFVLCRPGGYSWIEPWGRKPEDLRQVNPGWRQDEFVDDGQWGLAR